MAYVLGPVIGAIGGSGTVGSEIDMIDVEAEASGGTGSVVVLHTIDVQPGESVLVSFVGTVTPSSGAVNNHPTLSIGAVTAVRNDGPTGIAAVLTETATFQMTRQTGISTDRIAGTLYVTRV